MEPNRCVDFRLLLISDRNLLPPGLSLLNGVEQALNGGLPAIQLREKDLPARDLFRLAEQLRDMTRRYGATLLINDRLDVALAVEADGVQLGGKSLPTAAARRILGPNRLIGCSCHSLADAQQAAIGGADFITFSPVYFTPSKAPFGPPQGLAPLQAVCAASPLPVFALGGINLERVPAVLTCGAAGVALISAILAAPDPQQATRALLAAL